MTCVNLFKVYYRSTFGSDNNAKYLRDCSKHSEYDPNLAINSYFIELYLGLELKAMK